MNQARHHFDTLEFTHDLEFAGIRRKHAEAEAKALSRVFNYYFENMASKEDLDKLEVRLEHQIDNLRQEMKNGFQAIENKFEQIDTKFEQIDTRLDKIDSRLNQIDMTLAGLDGRFAQLSQQLTIRLGSMMCAGIGVLSFLFIYFH